MTLLLISALACGISCRKGMDANSEKPLPGASAGSLLVHIGLPDASTKSASADVKDYRINSVQVLVFDHNERLETDCFESLDSSAENKTSVRLSTTTGDKTLYAILNHDALKLSYHGTTLDEFEETLADLSENRVDHLVMSGKVGITVQKYEGASAPEQSVNIYVKRLVSQIIVEQVSVNFDGTPLEGGTFSIQEIYLKNVVGKCPLGMSGTSEAANSDVPSLPLSDTQLANTSNWYNKATKQASGAPVVTFDPVSISCKTKGEATDVSRSLFAFPNKTTKDSHDDVFCPRMTRVVIKAHIKAAQNSIDKDSYYVFDLPVLDNNHRYKIKNISITMPGNDDDDKDYDTQTGRILPTITVDPWSGDTELNYEF